MSENFGIFWFRHDLRLKDNLALNRLIYKCDKVILIYILDENIHLGGATKWWLHHSLKNLNKSLKEKKSQIIFFKGSPKKILNKLIDQFKIKYVHWNRLYDSYSIERDLQIKKDLNKDDIEVKSFNGSLINEPWTIKNKSGTFFKVFTPYWNTCLEETKKINLSESLNHIPTLFINSEDIFSLNQLKLYPLKSKWTKIMSSHWVPGEKQALENFSYFKKNIIEHYDDGRDRPDKNFTSKLSPYLHFGEISPKRIFSEIQKKKTFNLKSKKKYLAEIGWREFSYNLLYHYPNIKTEPIQKKFKKFPWKKNKKYLKVWQQGKTGYPIVDAGMKQLYKTGWMHNRVRMIVGSFLCKNLLIHWWEGEKWFFDTLVDADFASNAAGWQWIAGCGADAAPYFRVFNPLLQGIKFDPEGKYVKKYLPALNDIPPMFVHSPWKLTKEEQIKFNCKLGKDYPKPIVNLSESRDKALIGLSKLKNIN